MTAGVSNAARLFHWLRSRLGEVAPTAMDESGEAARFVLEAGHVQAAALPWRKAKSGIEIMLVTSLDTGRWILPKGWIEKSETPREAAIREAREEAGLKGKAAQSPIGTYFYDKIAKNGEIRRCAVDVYPLQVERQAKKWPEMSKRECIWVGPEAASAMVDEPDLGGLIAGFDVRKAKKSA
ncbi:MAG: NUDIX hydrolase [Nitratireductor sp.]